MLPVLIAVMAMVLAFSALGTAYAEPAAVCPDGQYPGNEGCVSPQCTDGKTALVVDENGNIEYHCIDKCTNYSLDTAPGTDMCKGYGLIEYNVGGVPDRNALYSKSGCPDILPFWDGNSCVAACPSGLAAGINCMEQCADDTPIQDGAQCVAACPADRPLSTGTECVAMCPTHAPFKLGITCIEACPAGMSEVGRVCVPGFNTAGGTSEGTEPAPMPDLCNFGIPGRVNQDLISSATMDENGMTVHLADPSKQFQRYVLNFCNAATGEKAGTGTSDISNPIRFDNDGNRLVMSYDPHTIYKIQAVGNNPRSHMISPVMTVLYVHETAEQVGGQSGPDTTPQPSTTQQYVPAPELEPETAQQNEPPRLPSKSSSSSNQGQSEQQEQQQQEQQQQEQQQQEQQQQEQQQQEQQQQEQQQQEQQQQEQQQQEPAPETNDENEAKRQNLQERIDRLDYRIGVAQDLLDKTKPHQEKRIEKLNALIDKLTDRKAVLQERLDSLS